MLHMCSNCYMEGKKRRDSVLSVLEEENSMIFFFLDRMGALSFSSSVFD